MFSPGQEEPSAPNKEPVKYGELVVLGYNGALPNGDRGRRKSRFALYKRTYASGVKPSTIHMVSTPQASKLPAAKHYYNEADSESLSALTLKVRDFLTGECSQRREYRDPAFSREGASGSAQLVAQAFLICPLSYTIVKQEQIRCLKKKDFFSCWS
ncbi:pellino 2, isoform CRA_b [Mus musculus]|nr:pellino 2, isoform CRA_b [Mus musculus]